MTARLYWYHEKEVLVVYFTISMVVLMYIKECTLLPNFLKKFQESIFFTL